MKCLILDDSKAITGLLQLIIMDELGAAEALVANNVADALLLLENNPASIDVVFCDLNLPDVDGVAFLRMLAEQGFQGYIVIVSSVSHRVLKSVEHLVRNHQLKFLGTIIKPISPQSVVQLLQSIGSHGAVKPPATVKEKLTVPELIEALEMGYFECYYQPQVCAMTRNVVGFEALARLKSPKRDLVFPDDFIALMEQHSLILRLTKDQIISVFKQWKIWHQQGHCYRVAINISALLLNDLELPGFILEQINKYGIKPTLVTLEITESCLNEDRIKALEVLSRLSMYGINLSIDDFGTGYSSIERLQSLPFNEVKIDRLFVQNAVASESERPVLDSMIGMANRLGLRVVLEGVETLAHWQMVCHSGCDSFQGYFIAKPMSVDKLEKWLRDWDKMTH
ncbi:EAL domain-containing response regulator [Neptunomonas qingdaonensis]|uniref:EAL domain, c-di-GMP-specific phosphodiesterase class I (Or its enzymatically inactive variant) n=1 Tax=Neptunomonas qingdaonensis TaxID=1045558 RepID=A0A1I2LXP2_9GAMM|nr:EAL domain-containing response regulator [Neptunomonas qingdaonensis]SFF84082.1 EAL domain, c-di-GMP-specific phosphodiesterase class I (or its enzymatically inactive variant) [Neptunomonas qingdaonensis]